MSGQSQLQIRGVRPDDDGHIDGVKVCLLVLRRNAELLVDIVTSSGSNSTSTTHPPPASREEIMKALMDMERRIELSYYPTWEDTAGASAGAAHFLLLSSFFTGVKVKEGVTAVGLVSLRGGLYEVSG